MARVWRNGESYLINSETRNRSWTLRRGETVQARRRQRAFPPTVMPRSALSPHAASNLQHIVLFFITLGLEMNGTKVYEP